MEYRIKELCKERKLTLSQLAESIKTTQTSLSRALGENGNPTIETLQKIATALGVEIWELFTESTDKSKMIALIYGDQLYRASTLEELQSIVDELKNKRDE